MEYKQIKLKNNLRLILVPKTSTEVVTAMIMFRVGSRQETDDIAGISHFLEHMHFKGTVKRPTAMKLAEFIESTGGEHNAFTSKEYTGYYAKITPKHIPEAFDFLSDLLLGAIFDETELNREKGVIIQEINMYQDLPMEMVGVNFEEAIFGKNALGRDVIGFKKSVNVVDRKSMISYRDKYYKASNAVLVLAGNFGKLSEKEIGKLAEEYFTFSDGAVPKTKPIKIVRRKEMSIIQKKTEQSHLIIGFETISFNHPDFFALELLAIILGGSMSSRMFEEIREKRGLAYSVKTHTSNFYEGGVLFTQAGVEHGKVYETIEAMMQEYSKIKNEPVPTAELAKAKEIIAGKTLIKFEDSGELAHHYAGEALMAKKMLTPKGLVAIYQKISANDILKVTKKYFVAGKMTLSFIGEHLDKNKVKKIFHLK